MWEGHVRRMRDLGNVYRILIAITEGKWSTWISRLILGG
jgi:hypothetical protein